MLSARDALSAERRRVASTAITAKIALLPEFRQAAMVLAYMSFGSEFDTGELILEIRRQGKTLALPRVERGIKALALHRVGACEGSLAPGPWGIREPDPRNCPSVDASSIDFVLVPGVCFTEACARLGYGGGYYDRLLATLRADTALIAAAFDVQMVAELPMGPNDRHLNRVVTESCDYIRL